MRLELNEIGQSQEVSKLQIRGPKIVPIVTDSFGRFYENLAQLENIFGGK